MTKCKHKVRAARGNERKEDCCNDRSESNVAFVCACGERGCRSCIHDHLLEVHRHD